MCMYVDWCSSSWWQHIELLWQEHPHKSCCCCDCWGCTSRWCRILQNYKWLGMSLSNCSRIHLFFFFSLYIKRWHMYRILRTSYTLVVHSTRWGWRRIPTRLHCWRLRKSRTVDWPCSPCSASSSKLTSPERVPSTTLQHTWVIPLATTCSLLFLDLLKGFLLCNVYATHFSETWLLYWRYLLLRLEVPLICFQAMLQSCLTIETSMIHARKSKLNIMIIIICGILNSTRRTISNKNCSSDTLFVC